MNKMREMKNSGIEWIGEIPTEWEITTIKKAYTFQTGWTPDAKKEDNFIGDNVWVNISDMNSKVIFDSNKHISDDAVAISSMNISPKGSLLYSFKLSVGNVAFCGVDLYTNEAIATFLEGENSLKYLYYIAPVFIIKNANENIYGAKLLNQSLIRNAKIVLPPLSEQHRIADFLDEKCAKIDAVIEKQKQVIEKLKEYKFSVLYDLFLNGIDNEAIKWNEFRLGDIASYKKGPFGSAITLSMFVEKANDTFKIYEQKNAIYKDATLGHYYINEGKYKELESFSVLPNDIIVSCAGTIGQCYILPENAEIGIINQALMRVRVFENYDVNYVCELLNVLLIEIADEFSNGSAIKNIPPFSVLKKYKIRIPDLKRQKELITYIKNEKEKIDSAIAKKQAIIEKLTEYKKSLIYEVVTGKKEV